MSQIYKSLSIAEPHPKGMSGIQLIGSASAAGGLFILVLSVFNPSYLLGGREVGLSLLLIALGVIAFSWKSFCTSPAGIKNNGIWISSWTARGLAAWCTGIIITLFYVALYWYPQTLGLAQTGQENTGLVRLFDPLSMALKGQSASQWFVYGSLYTLAILVFGVRFIWKYRHNRYQVFRTISVMFFQLGFAFLLPEFMQRLHYPYHDFKNMWPLNYYFFDEWNIKAMLSSGHLGFWMLVSGILMIFLVSPLLTYFYGKRWYCSWVCGCGGLAETAGDPYRQLSDKSLKAWQIERWMIHAVLVFSVLMTVATLFSFFHNNGTGYWINKTHFMLIITVILGGMIWSLRYKSTWFKGMSAKSMRIATYIGSAILLISWLAFFTGQGQAFFIDGYSLRSSYGFLIGAAFSGVVGVGFYPLMGSRVWCRFGCPMAAVLGLQQRFFSRFRITTNGGQCISCGNCSTYCEMGIDVRAYAQKGQNIVRASCVGCGICAAVCPRGVLKLENGSLDIDERTIDIRNQHIDMEQ